MTAGQRRIFLFGCFAAWAASARADDEIKPLPAPWPATEIPSGALLDQPGVRREIGLTEKQRLNIALIAEEAQAGRAAALNPGDGAAFDFNAMMQQNDESDRLQRAAVAKLLSPAQRNRLQQIEWQREGWLALARPEVAGKVKLAGPQVAQIRAIVQRMRRAQAQAIYAPTPDKPAAGAPRKPPALTPENGFQGDMAAIMPGGGPLGYTPEAMQEQAKKSAAEIDRLLAAAGKEAAAVLDADQRAAFDRLLGPPFPGTVQTPAATAPAGTTPPARSPKPKPKNPGS